MMPSAKIRYTAVSTRLAATVSAYTAAGPLAVTAAQGHADKGAAAVPHHHGDGQGHHRQGEHHRVGGVAVGPQIVGVGNEDLVHDVVQCPHQQGDHAGNGVAAHEPPHVLRSQKSLECSIKYHFPSCKSPGDGHFCRKKSAALLQPDLRRNATRCGFIIPRRRDNFKCFFGTKQSETSSIILHPCFFILRKFSGGASANLLEKLTLYGGHPIQTVLYYY